jgi:pimeloyl-ACP methyl ester carboxylesterase
VVSTSSEEHGAPSVDDTLTQDDYDEFALLHENASEWGLPTNAEVVVSRESADVGPGQPLSYLSWGSAEPELVLLHGGGQNAHTWDTVALALGRPLVAIDLPGHGRSYRRDDRDYGPWRNVEALAQVLPTIAPSAAAVVGMSLGGATTIRLAAERPDLCRKAVIVDVTPQINDPSRELTTMERGSVSLIGGPPTYESFDEMAEAAIALSPHRAASGVRRGVRHNASRLANGRWTWRYDLFGPRQPAAGEDGATWADFTPLWDDVARINVPTMFLRGGLSPFVRDEDVAGMRDRLPALRVETVEGAGHAIQSDQPLELVRLVEDFVFSGVRRV